MEKQAQELAQDLVSYLDVTGKAINVALTEVKKADVEKKAAQELIPALVDQLVSAKLLTDADRKQAAVELGSHASALDVTTNIVNELTERLKTAHAKLAALNNGQAVAEDGDIQTPRTTKSAGAASDDPDMALLSLVPALASKYSS